MQIDPEIQPIAEDHISDNCRPTEPVLITREAAIAEAFRWFVMPGFAADLHQAGRRCRSPWLKNAATVKLSLEPKSDRAFAKMIVLERLLSGIRPSPPMAAAFAQAPVIARGFRRSKELAQAAQSDLSTRLRQDAETLIWSGPGVWIAAYSRFADQMLGLIQGNELRIREQIASRKRELNAEGLDEDVTSIADQRSRVLPTRHHYAAASLGAWVGGAINLQYLSHYATDPQIRRPSQNRDYAVRIGYSAEEGKALDEGGLIAVPVPIISVVAQAQQGLQVIGGISLDEFNLVNPPSNGMIEEATTEERLPGILVDKHYRASFWARPLKEQALYGSSNVFRDHYEEFYASRAPVDVVRCKHYCAPIYEVESLSELEALAAEVPKRGNEGIVYRGQTQLFLLNRPQAAARLMYGNSCAKEPSFGTSAARNRFDYDSLHFGLSYFLENYGLGLPRSQGAMGAEIFKAWREARISPQCEIDYAIMALAQHYGLPSHGLDVTTSVEVASWFATHLYETAPDGRAQYRTMQASDWPKDPANWPVVAIIQPVTWSLAGSLQDCHELDTFGLKALRPIRQQARFFLGGHSDHQNRLAEALVCLARLRPGPYASNLNFEQLFPSPTEDSGYRVMLEMAEFGPLSSLGANRVARFGRWLE